MTETILIRDYPTHAGKWIYNGYAKAWEVLGYTVKRWDKLNLEDVKDNTIMMATGDIVIKNELADELINFLSQAKKIYMFVTPTKFPAPWYNHPNYVDQTARKPFLVEKLKALNNIVFWTFCNVEIAPQYWDEWGKVHYVPLAFDSLSYEREYDPKYEFDVCYIGSRANNGFDSKYKIMKEYLSAFKDSGLKCGFFIDKNLTHEQECKILTNSHVCLNIHDDYQHKLRLDTNERTWKSLGLNGLLVSDYMGIVIPDYVYQCSSPQEMVEKVQELIKDYPLANKERNSNLILKEHTYIERCKKFEEL